MNQQSYIVIQQPWGEFEWDRCTVGMELECAGWHSGAYVETCETEQQVRRRVKILNGWD